MSNLMLSRLWLDSVAAGLLLLCFAYWWLGNGVHEAAGTVMFALLVAHNFFNRRWYTSIPRTRREPRSLFNVGVTLALLSAMLVLLATSVLISETLSEVLPPWGGFTARQVHTLSAYWALIIVAIHLGLRWPMLMGIARNALGIRMPNAARALALRTITAAITLYGIRSWLELGLGAKLSMQMALDWWDFEEAVMGFFVHCGAIAGLVISVTHYGVRLVQSFEARWTRADLAKVRPAEL